MLWLTDVEPVASDILGEIISILFGGISGVATGLGNGLSNLVKAIFINPTTGSLSIFGIMMFVIGGVSLSIGLGQKIMLLFKR